MISVWSLRRGRVPRENELATKAAPGSRGGVPGGLPKGKEE